MATHTRQSRNAIAPAAPTDDQMKTLAKTAGRSDFFQLLRRIEETDGRRFGRHGGPANEPARLGQHIRLSFATRDVVEMTDTDAPRVDVNVLGLLGPEGPMPLYMTRWVIARLSNRWFAGDSDGVTSDTAFRDLANTLQHRLIGLYWRAWADARAEIHAGHAGGPTQAILHSLARLGLPGTTDERHDAAKLRHATTLAQETRSPEQLTAYLSDVVGAPVTLTQFIGHWSDIPERLQSRLHGQYAKLGETAVAGARTFSRQMRAELRIGPLSRKQFLSFIDDPKTRDALRHAILFAAGHEITFDVRLVLARAEVPATRLGKSRLGITSWIGPDRNRDADDVVLGMGRAA